MVDIYNQFKDFKAFEVTFSDENGDAQKIYCSIRCIENDTIVIDANNQKNKNIFATVGAKLKLYIYTESGIYSASSSVLQVDKGIINTEYVIEYPTDSKHSQRREYFRADMPIPFELEVNDKNEGQITFQGKTKNICGKGMCFVSDKPIYESEDTKIKATVTFEEKTITSNATLVYSKQIEAAGIQKYVHAFAFNDISQKEIDFIVKKCFLHQLDLRKQHKI